MDIEKLLKDILKRLAVIEERQTEDKEEILEELRTVQEGIANISTPGRDYDIYAEGD